MIEDLLPLLRLEVVAFPELILRIVLAMGMALIIGIDRESKDKPIDFRAYMIIAVCSCAIAIAGQEVFASYRDAEDRPSVDLAKIIEGVLTGIGFLGAGAIIKRGDIVVGTATGASIWASGALGLALGFGFYEIATILFIAVAATLVLGGWYREKFQGVADTGPNKKERMNEDQ